MRELDLRLSNIIEGEYKTRVTKCNHFYINKAFKIDFLYFDDNSIDFSEEYVDSNYKIIYFDDLDGEIKIKYNGILDGTTGVYPYVREKTEDPFYILRHETCYYPMWYEPNTNEYFNHLINPPLEDLFSVKVVVNDNRAMCSNLKYQQNEYVGYNPTIVVGDYVTNEYFFGELSYVNLEESIIKDTVNTIKSVNDYMNRYKVATIEDYKIIVIPEGYGSFVLQNTMFITKDSLMNKQQLIHELVHTNWNPQCDEKCQRSRFFDEAITQYFTYRICDCYKIKSASETEEEYLQSYVDIMTTYDITPTPIIKYGDEGLGDLSYSFGALALIALEKAIGIEEMDVCLKVLLKEYDEKQVNFELFRDLFPLKTKHVFDEYFYSDYASKEFLKKN
ncbi:MAG: hypothetical protein IKY26_01375 [Erysipelotrichaceae bacterium]|nr:hypothetical protein [Erysipelotrichaceae bacterium]MBR6517470.1 hypothetical protein [Bacilli bacterium]